MAKNNSLNLVKDMSTLNNTTIQLASSLPNHIIADTGATGHFLQFSTPLLPKTPVNPGITVLLLNGSMIESTHTAILSLPHVPPDTCLAHVFLNLASGLLLSIGSLCESWLYSHIYDS